MGLFDWLTGGDDSEGSPDGRDRDQGDPEEPLKVAVDSVLSVGRPAIVTGRVERGTVSPGDRLVAPGAGVGGRVITVERDHQAVETAGPGDFVGLELEGVGSGELRDADRLREP
jgi:translation elongation factor EF-1alpha